MKNSKTKPKSFRGTLEHLRSGLGWVIVRLPFDVKKTWGGSRVKVRGEVNGATFRTSVFPEKDGGAFLLINKQVQRAARIVAGSTAEFHVELDDLPRQVEIPVELARVLSESKRLEKWFTSLSYSYRLWISRWVAEPKSSQSRRRRADQIGERIMETMEAERELPPLIKLALERNSMAREGWKLMTERQRRGELMAVFGYRSPEARARRLEKTLEFAKGVSERSRDKTLT